MSVVPMQKVAVIAHRSKREELIDFLHKEGVMEISDLQTNGSVDHTEVRFRAAEVDFAIAKLTEVASKETLAAAQKPANEQDIIRAAMHADLRGIIDEVHALEKEYDDLQHALHQLNTPQAATASAEMQAPEEGAYFTASNVQTDLSAFGGDAETVAAEARKQEEERRVQSAEIQRKTEINRAALARLSSELPNLVRARQYISWLDEKQAVREAMHETRSTVTLMGWITRNLFEKLEKKLHKVSPATALLKIEPQADEQAPVLLKNSKIMKPFESVTTLYGLPQAAEIDPTPLLAPFFILFFGLCLTDAGYGLALSMMTGAYLLLKKKSIEEARLVWLLFIGGLVTFFVSIPFGGWFGLTPDQAPAFMVEQRADGNLWFKGQLWNLGETKGITFLQNLAIALGLIHLTFGIFLSGYVKWRVGERAAAIWSDWTTIVLFAAIGVAAYGSMTDAPWAQQAVWGIYASLALVIWGKGYGSKWYIRPLMGLLGVINLAMGMLSNTLSYLRLLALGLVTGALALAVNLVAQQVTGLLPFAIGLPIAILIYVMGHTVNIALNTLGAFIHSGRLQFVEFFGNFFEGGGQPFKPFARSIVSR